MKDDLMDLRVTIMRPEANETPQEVSIGLAQLAHVIAGMLKRENQDEKRTSVTSLLDLVEDAKEV